MRRQTAPLLALVSQRGRQQAKAAYLRTAGAAPSSRLMLPAGPRGRAELSQPCSQPAMLMRAGWPRWLYGEWPLAASHQLLFT